MINFYIFIRKLKDKRLKPYDLLLQHLKLIMLIIINNHYTQNHRQIQKYSNPKKTIALHRI